MEPIARFMRLYQERYVVDDIYKLDVHEDRSPQSHNFYFASLAEAHSNLPDIEADRFPTPEHLRKWALIKAGYADQRQHPCPSKAEALRLAGFIRPMDEYAIVVATEAVVTVYTAQSQSRKAMGKKTFEASKSAVLEIVWALVGMKPEDAAQHVGRAA